MSNITVQTTIDAEISTVWEAWTNPSHIIKWSFASDDWEAPYAENNLDVGGTFTTTMAAKDGSDRFDVTGTYTHIVPNEIIEYTLDDGRQVTTTFHQTPDGIQIVQTFDAEELHSEEQQRQGWQAILDNFKKYVENV